MATGTADRVTPPRARGQASPGGVLHWLAMAGVPDGQGGEPLEEGRVRLGEAARRAGVTVAQLQYYCYMQVVEPTALTRSGQRLFDARAIRRIRMVKMLNDGGYPLREIREVFMHRARR